MTPRPLLDFTLARQGYPGLSGLQVSWPFATSPRCVADVDFRSPQEALVRVRRQDSTQEPLAPHNATVVWQVCPSASCLCRGCLDRECRDPNVNFYDAYRTRERLRLYEMFDLAEAMAAEYAAAQPEPPPADPVTVEVSPTINPVFNNGTDVQLLEQLVAASVAKHLPGVLARLIAQGLPGA